MREGPKGNSSWPSSSCRVLASVASKDRIGDRTMRLFPAQLLLLLLLPGCSTARNPITGPEEVRGQEQGFLMVQCPYTSPWRSHRKYWCRGPDWNTCEILVQTDVSEQVKKNRVSIMDDQTDLIVTVTMEDLRMSDADVYWCRMDRVGYDHKFKVVVNIDPAPEVSPKIMTTIATVLTSTSPTTESTGNQGVNPTSPLAWSLQGSLYFKLLVFLELPVFLSMLSAVLWVNRPQRCCGP